MITNALVHAFFSILDILIAMIPTPGTNSIVDGISSTGVFLGQVIYVTAAFVPWGDVFLMISIMFAITGIRFVFQVINLIWP